MATWTAQYHSPFRLTAAHCGSFTATTGTSTTVSSVSIVAATVFVFYAARNSTGHKLFNNTATTRTVYTQSTSKAGNSFKVRHKSGVSSAKINYLLIYN